MLTNYHPFIFVYTASYISEKYSDFCYNGFMCEHVYKYTNPGPCGSCGFNTHDPNWTKVNKIYAEYREKVGFFFNNNTWWTI